MLAVGSWKIKLRLIGDRMELTKGAFIVVEGVDGVGKTEQTHLLENKLKQLSINCLLTKTPGEIKEGILVGSTLGPVVRNVLFTNAYPNICYESKSLLLLADHLQLIEEVIKPGVQNKTLVISDRFMDSQFATWGRSIDDPINQTFSRFFRMLPDITILLIGDPTACFHRANNRSAVDNAKQATKPWSSIEGLKDIQDRYLAMLTNQTTRTVIVIDTVDKSIEHVHELIANRLMEWLLRNQYLTNESVGI